MGQSLKPLVNLGFTALEAEVYACLLEQSAATGYRIAQLLGKPAANVYKALESLQAKGAAVTDDGQTRRCRAVPAEEVLAQLERRFRSNRDRAARTLAEVAAPRDDDRVYRLTTPEQVFERCRAMVRRARKIVLLDVFPELLEELRDDVERRAREGVDVAILTYAPAEVVGARVIVHPRGGVTRSRWPGNWVTLTVDGSEHLVALVSADGKSVHQAIWTGSLYLSWVYHSALSCEAILAAIEGRLERGASTAELQEALQELLKLKAVEAPGYHALLRRLQSKESETRTPGRRQGGRDSAR